MRRLFLCLLLMLAAPLPASAQAWQQYHSDSGWTSFWYPTGWAVIPTDRAASRYLENYAVQPRGQDFTGQPGQVVVRLFDPMYVAEEARARSPAGSLALFQTFIRTLPGAQGATFNTYTYENRSYFYAEHYGEGMGMAYAGFVGENGYLSVLGVAAPARELAQRRTLLFQMAGSSNLRGPGPMSGAASAMSQWYSYLRGGDTNALHTLSCSRARDSMTAVWLGGLLSGMGDPMAVMARAAYNYDFSGLRYQTVSSGNGRAAVRVSGNVAAPNGAITPFHQYARNFGGSNVFFVTSETGGWKVCGPVRGGSQ